MKQVTKAMDIQENITETPYGYKRVGNIIIPEDWELKKFGDFVRKVKRKNIDNLPLEPCSVSKQYGVIYQNEKFTKRIATVDTTNYYIVRKGEFVYDPMSAYYGAVGRQKYNEDVVVSPAYEVFDVAGVNKDFFEQVFTSERIKRLYSYLSYGGNEYWKRMKLSWDSFCNIKFPVPPLHEQEYIAKVLKKQDEYIKLIIQEIIQKEEQKKGLMRKLVTGELRLREFEGDWKRIRLGDVLKERKETGYNELELLSITAKRGVVRRKEIDIKDNSSDDKSKYKRILPNDIGYNTMRMWQGISGVSQFEGIVSPAYTVLTPTSEIDPYFMAYLFKYPETIYLFWRYSQGIVDDTLNLKYSNFKKIRVTIPSDILEQKAIAKVLSTQDKIIELLEKSLDLEKDRKNGLMQSLLTGKSRVKV